MTPTRSLRLLTGCSKLCAVFLKGCLLSAGLSLFGSAWANASAATDDGSGPIRIGILATVGKEASLETFRSSIETLKREAWPDAEVSYYDIPSLEKALAANQLDFFISNPGFFAEARYQFGARHLATLKDAQADDPNFSMGGVILASASRTDLSSLADLKGKRVLAVDPQAFGGYYVPLGEIKAQGFDPFHFFGSVDFTGYPMQKVVETFSKAQDRYDAILIRTCLFEEMAEAGAIHAADFRTINPKTYSNFRCRASTALYPGWVFASTVRTSPRDTKRAAAVLLNLPPAASGLEWSIANRFQPIDELYRSLRVGRFKQLDELSIRLFIQEHRELFILLAALLAAGIIHAVTVERTVRKRTASLQQALAEQRSLQKKAAEVRERLEATQNAGMMGMLSNMVAHELKQPLGAIANYVEGMRDLVDSEKPRHADLLQYALAETARETKRASDIIEHVRSYAGHKHRQKAPILLAEFVPAVLSAYKRVSTSSHPLRFDPMPATDQQAKLVILGDRTELELVLLNLIKNADAALSRRSALGEAAVCDESSVISVSIGFPINGEVGVCVRNPGTLPSDFNERTLFEPKPSASASGLGLGLAICARIMEAHGGRLMLSNTPNGEVEAWMIFPL